MKDEELQSENSSAQNRADNLSLDSSIYNFENHQNHRSYTRKACCKT